MNAPGEMYENIVCAYSRADAIEDGVLVDVSKEAKKAGFIWPVAVTESVWCDYIEWTDEDSEKQTSQTTAGRLWDVLCLSMFVFRQINDGSSLIYKISVIPRDGRAVNREDVKLKAEIGIGDKGEPVITIMQPHED